MLPITDTTYYLESREWTTVKKNSEKSALKQRSLIIFTVPHVLDWMRNSRKRPVKTAGG